MDKLAKKLVENLEKKEKLEEATSLAQNVANQDNAKIQALMDRDTRKGPSGADTTNHASKNLDPEKQTENGEDDQTGNSIVAKVRARLKIQEDEYEDLQPEDVISEDEEDDDNSEIVNEDEDENSEQERIDVEAVLKELKEKKVTTSDFNLEEDMRAIFKGQDLTEDFKAKAKRIYETSVVSTANQAVESMYNIFEQVFAEKLEIEKDSLVEEYAQYVEDLNEKVNDYLTFVVENWMEENQVPLERSIKTEIAESFMEALQNIMQEHYIEIPESKIDVVQEMSNRLDELEEKYNELVVENIEVTKERNSLIKEIMIEDISGDLSEVEKSKLSKLAEGIDIEDIENFGNQLVEIKESFFGGETSTYLTESTIEDNEEVEVVNENFKPSKEVDPFISGVAHSLKKILKK